MVMPGDLQVENLRQDRQDNKQDQRRRQVDAPVHHADAPVGADVRA